MIRTYLFFAVFTIALKMPVNGAVKASKSPQPGFKTEVGADRKWGSPRQPGSDFLNITVAFSSVNSSKYPIQVFKVSEITLIPVVILFMEQESEQLSQKLLILLIGFGLGYLVRHLISVRRRKRAREWDAERSSTSGHDPSSRDKSIDNVQKTHHDITKTASAGTVASAGVPVPSGTVLSPGTVLSQGTVGSPGTVTSPGTAGMPETAGVPVTATPKSDIIPEEKSPEIVLQVVNNMPKPKLVDTLYFPNPNKDGTFRQSEGRETFNEGASIYKFTLTSATSAKFEFCKDKSSVGIALNNRNELILGVADETNPYNSTAQKIEIADNKYGTAELEGGVWTVKTKAKIRYA